MGKRVWALLVWSGCCVAGASLPAQNAETISAMEQGVSSMRAGQLGEAEQHFRRAVALSPRMAEAQLDLGLVLAREGKMDGAIQALRDTLLIDPRMPSAHQFLGIFLYSTHHPEQGRKELMAELAIDPNNLDTLTYLGDADLAAGRGAEAAAWLDRASALAPDDLNVLELRGRAHSQVAHDSYAKMAQLAPDSWHVHRVQAQLYAEDGRHQDAIVEYKAAIEREAGNPDLYERLGDEYRATSQLEPALAAYTKELALTPENEGALYNVGSLDVELGNSAAGVPLLLRAVELYPGSGRAEYYLGRGLGSLGRDAEAADWFGRAANDDPDGEIAKRSYFELARTDRKLHRLAAAEAATASYNRIRLLQEKAGQQQVERFRTQAQSSGGPGATSSPQKP